MSDIIWPSDLVPFQQEFRLQPHTGRTESPFTRQQKVYGLSAARWVCTMSFRGGYDGTTGIAAYGPRLDALITDLAGGARRTAIYDFRRDELRGANDAADLSNDAAAAGATSVMVTGAGPSTLIARAGDYIGGDGRPHIVTKDATANSSGNALVHFKPPLASALLAGQMTFGNPRGYFRLTSDDAGSNAVQAGDVVNYALEFVEDYWTVDQALAYPPVSQEAFATFNVASVLPDSSDKFKGVRLSTNEFLFRQYIDATGFIEEYVYRRINGDDAYPTEGGAIPVNDGLQLMSKRTYAFGRVFQELLQPENAGLRTATEFAFRIGLTTDDYATINANVNGFGHGRMTTTGVTLQLDGAGANLIEVADWPVGLASMKTGDGMNALTVFSLLLPDDDPGVELNFTQNFGSTHGLRETGYFTALESDVVFQDSPLANLAFNFGDEFAVNRVKLDGEATILTPAGDTILKSPWGATVAEYYQGYHSDEPSIVFTLRAAKRVIQDNPGETLDPYEFCAGIRVGMVDQPDFTKVVGYAQSTGDVPVEEREPTALPVGTTYFFDNFRRTYLRPDGAI